MLLSDFDTFIRTLLPFETASKADSALNGLQVDRANQEINRVAFAVDASLETFRRAVTVKADLLFVHHGLFFGGPKPLTGNRYARFRYLVQHDLALYAVHLPLDMADDLGNNAGIARELGLNTCEPFGEYHGVKIGIKGILEKPLERQAVVEKLCGLEPLPASFLPFGPDIVHSVGIVSGGAPETARDAIAEGLDLFVTGDRSHEIYHECQEAHLNVVFAGHYASEVFGVKAVCEKLASESKLETVFIDVPTGF